MHKFTRPLIIISSLLVLYGCPAAWFAAGGVSTLGGYKYMEGRVAKEYPLAYEKAWKAANRALAKLRINIVSSKNDGSRGKIDALREDGKKVAVKLKSSGNGVTNIAVKVGTFTDREEAEKIHRKIRAAAGI